MIAHDQARNGRYGRIDNTIPLHNLINSLSHRTIRSFISDSSCAGLPPSNLFRIHLFRLLPSLLEESIRFLLLVHLLDVDCCIFELYIPRVPLLLSEDVGPLALIWSFPMGRLAVPGAHGADDLPVARFRVVIHGTHVMLCKGQGAVTVHLLCLEDVGGLLIDQLLVRHIVKSLLALLCLRGLLLFILSLLHLQQILIQMPSRLRCECSPLSSNR